MSVYQDQLANAFGGVTGAKITGRSRHVIPGDFVAKFTAPVYEMTKNHGPGVFTQFEILSFRGGTAINEIEGQPSSQVPDFWFMPGDRDVAIKIMMSGQGSDVNLKALGLALAQQIKCDQGGKKTDIAQDQIDNRMVARMCDPEDGLSQLINGGLILAFRAYHHRTNKGNPWTNYEFLPQANPSGLILAPPTAEECAAYMGKHSDDMRRLTSSGKNELQPSQKCPIVLTYAAASIGGTAGAPDPLGLGNAPAAPPATAPSALGGILGAPPATTALGGDPLGLGTPAPAPAADPLGLGLGTPAPAANAADPLGLGLGAPPAPPTRDEMIAALRAAVPAYATLDFSTVADAVIAEGYAKVAK